MTQKTIGDYTKYIADEGKFLTQVEATEDKIFAVAVVTDHIDQWTEWTAEQREQWERQHPSEEQET